MTESCVSPCGNFSAVGTSVDYNGQYLNGSQCENRPWCKLNPNTPSIYKPCIDKALSTDLEIDCESTCTNGFVNAGGCGLVMAHGWNNYESYSSVIPADCDLQSCGESLVMQQANIRCNMTDGG